jgi:hypothetical protein
MPGLVSRPENRGSRSPCCSGPFDRAGAFYPIVDRRDTTIGAGSHALPVSQKWPLVDVSPLSSAVCVEALPLQQILLLRLAMINGKEGG